MRQNSSLKDQLTAAKRLLLCCTTPGISREADCELLFLAVGQFFYSSAPTQPSEPGFQDLRRLSAWKELLLLLPMCCVKFCSHCLLCCEVACPPFPSRLLARSNDVTSRWAQSFCGPLCFQAAHVTHPGIQ